MGYQPLITDVNNIHENQPQTKKTVSDINWKKTLFTIQSWIKFFQIRYK